MCSKDPRCQSKPRLTKIFYKKADGKYFRRLQLYSLCCNSAVFHRRKITKNINKVQSCFLINLYLQNRLWARVRAGIFDSRSVCPESLGKFEMPFFGGVWLLSNEMQRNLTQSWNPSFPLTVCSWNRSSLARDQCCPVDLTYNKGLLSEKLSVLEVLDTHSLRRTHSPSEISSLVFTTNSLTISKVLGALKQRRINKFDLNTWKAVGLLHKDMRSGLYPAVSSLSQMVIWWLRASFSTQETSESGMSLSVVWVPICIRTI